MGSPALLRIPRPKTFLYLISLRTATELIILTLLINKVSGVYGILALLTGFHLSALQLSMYIYSIIVLGLVCYLAPHIKRQSPLQCLALAWIYLIDSLINMTYTGLFGTTWFVLLARHLNEGAAPTVPGGKMMNDTAGFTDPETNATKVDVVATPAEGAIAGQDAVAVGKHDASLGSAVFDAGSVASISVICALWAVRIYFCLIVMAYARGVLRQYILTTSASSQGFQSASKSSDMAENPFSEDREEGQGWKGKLGRSMTSIGQSYWLGKDDEDKHKCHPNSLSLSLSLSPLSQRQMSPAMEKPNKIRHIVRILQMLKRWRKKAASSSLSPPDVPSGHVAVCVGADCKRFVVRATHLNHPVFQRLLAQAEEEYGFARPGPLALPCDESVFQEILRVVARSGPVDPARPLLDLEDFQRCCHVDRGESGPLLRGIADKSVC